MPERHRTFDAIVLHRRDLRESDRIIEVLTPNEGRISLLARGARASRKRFVGALDLFVGLHINVCARGNLWTLTSAQIKHARVGIRCSLSRIQRASCLVDCTRLVTVAHSESDVIYNALHMGLDALHRGDLSKAAMAFPRILHGAGLMLDVGSCQRCGDADSPAGINNHGHDILCQRCAPNLTPLHPSVRAALGGAPIEDPQVADHVATTVIDLIEQFTGRSVRSRATGVACTVTRRNA